MDIRTYTLDGCYVMDEIDGFKAYLEVAEVGRVLMADAELLGRRWKLLKYF